MDLPSQRIFAIGASAGGVEALRQIVRALPGDFPAPILVVVHFPPESPSVLPSILDRAGALRSVRATHGEVITPGTIYVAPPGWHLLLEGKHLLLTRGPRENGYRPAIDALFRSVAGSAHRHAVGIVLSGNLADGSAGLAEIKRHGGVAIVQDPEDAIFPGMPRSALEVTSPDHVVPLARMAETMVVVANTAVPKPGAHTMPDETLSYENRVAKEGVRDAENGVAPGRLAGYGCPDCGGTLWELPAGEILRFRCRVGHAWTAENLLAEQAQGVESALWTALRALEESAQLSRQIAERMSGRGAARAAETFARRATDNEESALILRQLLVDGDVLEHEPAETPSREGDARGRAPDATAT